MVVCVWMLLNIFVQDVVLLHFSIGTWTVNHVLLREVSHYCSTRKQNINLTAMKQNIKLTFLYSKIFQSRCSGLTCQLYTVSAIAIVHRKSSWQIPYSCTHPPNFKNKTYGNLQENQMATKQQSAHFRSQ